MGTNLEHLELCPSQALPVGEGDVREERGMADDGGVGVTRLVGQPLTGAAEAPAKDNEERGQCLSWA
jgi:hypothetical protein